MEKRVLIVFIVSLVLRIDRIASKKAVRVEFIKYIEVTALVNVIDSDDNRQKKAPKAFAFMSP